MDNDGGEAGPAFQNSDDTRGKSSGRGKRHAKKKITLIYLLKVICASRESCLEWLKNSNLIPKILFCPDCNNKMKFEVNEQAIDGYVWICQECTENPPQFSSRHSSWLESKDAPLVDILLFTYLWSHGFNEAQICKETNMSPSMVEEWNVVYSTICDSLHQRSMSLDEEFSEGNSLDMNKESYARVWRNKNKYKDPFLEFLKDADSL